MGSQIWASVVSMAWVASRASMASMASMAQGSTDVEVPLVPTMVASNGGDEWWRRWWVASMDGFDGWRRWWLRLLASMVGVVGWLGSSTQRALTWKSLCVPSSEGDTHSGSVLFVEQCAGYQWLLSPCLVLVFVTVCCVSCSTVWPAACVFIAQS